jgi:hypothetical protein
MNKLKELITLNLPQYYVDTLVGISLELKKSLYEKWGKSEDIDYW